MKKNLLIAAPLFFITLNASAQASLQYLDENLLITGIMYVRISKDSFVKQVQAIDFNKGLNVKTWSFCINNEPFSDEGRKRDEQAGDGRYSSYHIYVMQYEKRDTVVISDLLIMGKGFRFKFMLYAFLAREFYLVQDWSTKIMVCDFAGVSRTASERSNILDRYVLTSCLDLLACGIKTSW